jgi:hypothetical protein
MTTKSTKKKIDDRPKLVKIGKHLINIQDVSRITQIKRRDEESGKKLFVIKFTSDPNPEYPCRIDETDIAFLISQFNVIVDD